MGLSPAKSVKRMVVEGWNLGCTLPWVRSPCAIVAGRMLVSTASARSCWETAFTRDVGLPGAALRAGSAVWLSDFVDEPSLPRMTAALAVGVRGAVSMPVRIDGQVAFVFELVARRDIARDEAAPALLALAAEEIACWVAATAQMTT